MNYLRELSTSRSRAALCLAMLGASALIAGCGSSSSTGTITIGNENKADETAFNSSGASGSTGAKAATTPTSGPLSTKPVVAKGTPPAPTGKTVTKEIIKGTGAEAKTGESVTVNYVGVLFSNGKEFDSSWKRNEPFPFTLGQGQVIKGWDEGIPGMKVGGRRELIIPAAEAYGAKGSPPAIPPNEPLIFVVDLLGT